MSATSLIMKQGRFNIKEIQKTKTILYIITGFNAEMVSEKYVKVRGATAEKKDLFTPGINIDIFGQPIPSMGFEPG